MVRAMPALAFSSFAWNAHAPWSLFFFSLSQLRTIFPPKPVAGPR